MIIRQVPYPLHYHSATQFTYNFDVLGLIWLCILALFGGHSWQVFRGLCRLRIKVTSRAREMLVSSRLNYLPNVFP